MARLNLVVFIVLLMLLVGGVPNVGVAGEGGAGAIGAGTVVLSADEHEVYPGVLRGFVATRSASPECLVTLREADSPALAVAVYCGPRLFNGEHGVLVTLISPLGTPPPGSFYELTVLQELANGYQPAVPYPGD